MCLFGEWSHLALRRTLMETCATVMAKNIGPGYSGEYDFTLFLFCHAHRCDRSCDVTVRELVRAFEVIVRAHDQKKNFQPEHITWYVESSLSGCLV